MDRRQFIGNILKAAAGFSVLPSALTYTRKWHKTQESLWVPNPEWIHAEYESKMMYFLPSFADFIQKQVNVP